MKRRVTHFLVGALAGASALIAVPSLGEVAQTPLALSRGAVPRVMFVISNDHSLYYKAYTDWNDLTGDGTPDTSYVHDFEYYGYFDPEKCYDYANGQFEPKSITTDGYCSGNWSGNFLNWASMSRMDIVRKVLYGGYRSTDTDNQTVLERSFIPTDAHSFAKFYAGADISKLTPFGGASLTLCNTTYATNGESQSVSAPPLIRVAQGDFRYWAANERWQCTWADERGNNSSGSNTTNSNESDPTKGGNNEDYIARVKVCVDGLVGTEDCKSYDGHLKPIGLLQRYGDDGELYFGLITGSYAKNKSGGVLRKNIASFEDEINHDNGKFTDAKGIVYTLNKFRIARYKYGDDNNQGLYNDSDSCPWAKSFFDNGKCSNWGNPLSEMYLESLRYYSGLGKTDAFNADDSSYISGLTSPAWTDPLNTENWCARCNTILINASDNSYDDDQVDASGLITAPDNAASLTDALGKLEGISDGTFFVGENGTDNNQLCTAKTVSEAWRCAGLLPRLPAPIGLLSSCGTRPLGSHERHPGPEG